MQRPKINKIQKTPHETTTTRRWLFYFVLQRRMCIKKALPWKGFSYNFGGAGGYRTRVQKVTDYSSTSLVCPRFLQPLRRRKDKQKVRELRGKMSQLGATAHRASKQHKYDTTGGYAAWPYVMALVN